LQVAGVGAERGKIPDPAQRERQVGLRHRDPRLDGLPHLDVPSRAPVDRGPDLPDHGRVGLPEQVDEAGLLAGEMLVERAARGAGVAHHVRDRRVAVAGLPDGRGHALEQPAAELGGRGSLNAGLGPRGAGGDHAIPPLADHGTLAYRRSGTHAYRISRSTAGGIPMARKRRPLAGWPVARKQAGPLVRKAAGPLARTPTRPLAGRPVMITGAASGIGRSLARRLSGLGSAVAIADIDEAGLKETARTLPGPVLVRVLDVRDAADQRRFAAEVREWLGSPPLAAVFNNAGVAVASSVLDADPDDDEWLRQINFDGVVNGTRAFLPIL